MVRSFKGLLGITALTIGMAMASHGDSQSQQSDSSRHIAAEEGFPTAGIVPKDDTQALQFLQDHPEYDGRGTVVAIFDTGCEPAAVGLLTTPQGESKFIDFIDATGSGDVKTSTKATLKDGKLTGLTGRTLSPNPEWNNPTGEFRLGMATGYKLFPHELVVRLSDENKKAWVKTQLPRIKELQAQITSASATSTPSKEELQARLSLLESAIADYKDPGPVFDCVVWHDGNLWRAVVDTNEDGNLADETVLTDYDKEPRYATFSEASRLNFTVHIYDEGNTLSIVIPSGDHGTHVAGIVGAYEADRPQRNGLAPGCRMISVKIGDTHLGGMETGTGLVRGIKAVLDHKCDLVNMSYGEPITVPDKGRIPELLNELVREHGVIFVASAGNSGPALSTVGAPGGTGSAIIGVGAYLSPEMMDVEYTSLEKREGTAYTWTSRGPTYDGDWGVDIFAPGGAIAPIPSYELQPMRQMNGTSMASPNACGNISLLLSALKQQKLNYTNWSILRAIQNTAEVIPGADRFAQGPGLIQVSKAYDHLTRWYQAPGEQIELQVAVAGRANARGIYLREPAETKNVFESSVSITPIFPDSASNDTKLGYELELKWSSDVDWASVGEHMILYSGGNRLPVRVDPTGLEEGVHTGEIVAHDANHPERSPLVRLPLTVVKPARPSGNKLHWDILSDAGENHRKFIAVPEGATRAELKIRRRDSDAVRMGFLHCVELIPGQSFEEGQTLEVLRIEPKSEATVQIPVTGGRTLEICWGHYWSSQGAADLEFDLTFRGLTTRDTHIALPSDGSATRVDIRAALSRETLQPSGSLTTLRKILPPTSAGEVKPLTGPRDSLWSGQRTHQRVLKYQFHLDSSADITLHVPELEGLLYDSPLDHVLMTLFDSRRQPLLFEDVFAEPSGDAELFPISLQSGDYTIELDLRHLDPQGLSRWSDVNIALDQTLSNSIRVPAWPTRAAAAGTGRPFNSAKLVPGEETTLWFRFPDGTRPPAQAKPGDLLLGSLKLTSEGNTPRGGDSCLLSYVVPAASSSGTGSSVPKAGNHEQAYLDFLIQQISARQWPQDEELINKLSADYTALKPNDRKLAVTRLHVIDSEDNENHLPAVLTAADAVIALIDQTQLQAYFGIRHNPLTDEERKVHNDRTSEKADLIDALYRKGRALAYMELPEVVSKHPITDPEAHTKLFEETFRELSKWVETTEQQYALLHLRKEWRQKNFGLAFKLLNQKFPPVNSDELHDRKRVQLYEEIGWNDWRDYQLRWNLRRYGKPAE